MTMAPSGPACTSCGWFERIRHVPPGPRSRVSPVDREVHRVADHHAELLGFVTVLRDHRVRYKLDDPEGDSLALDASGADGVTPDLEERERVEIGEVAHAETS